MRLARRAVKSVRHWDVLLRGSSSTPISGIADRLLLSPPGLSSQTKLPVLPSMQPQASFASEHLRRSFSEVQGSVGALTYSLGRVCLNSERFSVASSQCQDTTSTRSLHRHMMSLVESSPNQSELDFSVEGIRCSWFGMSVAVLYEYMHAVLQTAR